MKYLLSLFVAVSFVILYAGCNDPDEPTDTPPANLALQSVISNDGSGMVAFTATADNAYSFDFNFGNGDSKNKTNGLVNYQYTTSGTNTYSVTVTAVSLTGLTTAQTFEITVTVTGAGGLMWSDEFNTDGAPDPAKWGYDIGNGSGGWGNGELQYYTNRAENVIVQGGVLKINAIKELYSGYDYTSARILTKDKFVFKYGKVEISAKLPAGVGTWPALWMLGSDFETAIWPACGEIDIMEHKGSELNKIYGTFHYPGHSGGNASGYTRTISNATTAFHKYQLEWTSSIIKISVDDILIHSIVNSASIPFNHNFFFIFNVAMGGSFGGAVDPAFTNATMEVDYVRVYK